jgi:hypothetical protein
MASRCPDLQKSHSVTAVVRLDQRPTDEAQEPKKQYDGYNVVHDNIEAVAPTENDDSHHDGQRPWCWMGDEESLVVSRYGW